MRKAFSYRRQLFPVWVDQQSTSKWCQTELHYTWIFCIDGKRRISEQYLMYVINSVCSSGYVLSSLATRGFIVYETWTPYLGNSQLSGGSYTLMNTADMENLSLRYCKSILIWEIGSGLSQFHGLCIYQSIRSQDRNFQTLKYSARSVIRFWNLKDSIMII